MLDCLHRCIFVVISGSEATIPFFVGPYFKAGDLQKQMLTRRGACWVNIHFGCGAGQELYATIYIVLAQFGKPADPMRLTQD